MVLQSLDDLSDEQTEYLIRDRLSFMRLSRSGTRGCRMLPTIWLFREALAQAGLIDKPFERFGASISRPRTTSRAAAKFGRHDCGRPSSATRRRRTRQS